ncbi:prolipoprotein diacylglyceryl transferase [Cohnella massiliensis]|uniref:prolipoprotein diacylglyceryl transferase n=1 Tax=Cohnella massiliensis TaxID=1816691 RepID=UPI0009BA3519|nr:prolipoprotein diacylglyceryl transferase [Cohnella massiliensis]
MRVELFRIGDFALRSYGVVIAVAILLGASIAYYFARGTKYQGHVLGVLFYAVIGSIIGARIWHVFFFQWPYYSQHLGQIVKIWEGGLAIQGALVGGLIAGFIYTRVKSISFLEFADILVPAIIFGQGIGRIACFLNGDAYGSPTNSGFGIVYPKGTFAYDAYGSQPLWPAEIWEGQLDFVVFAILIALKSKKLPTGYLFLIYNMLYAAGRFGLEFLRGDSPRYLLNWTAGQWTSVTIIMACVIVMLVLKLRRSAFNVESARSE